ncbi:MAG: YciI family protein [bacterium]
MFIVSLTYIRPPEDVEKNLKAHRDFLKIQYEKGNFITSGRKVPVTGGIILASVKSKTDLEEILIQDPFHKEYIASYEVTEFTPTMTGAEFENLIGK